ncbi:MAG: site-2 protease family protein [Cyanobacteria bacterium SZAS LIN-2]|nr:site-2 protease family protein [Cyanobacteria bacterium SZAS LIN-2]
MAEMQNALAYMAAHLPGIAAMLLAMVFLIFVPHEFGHWLTARYYGFKALVFGIGFGYRRWSLILGNWWGTEFRLSPILLGGYVLLPEIDDAFQAAGARKFPVSQRIAVSLAGVAVNVLVAIVIMTGLFAVKGAQSVSYSTAVSGFSDTIKVGSEAGLKVNDVFVAIGGTAITQAQDVPLAFAASKDKAKSIPVLVMRDGAIVALAVRPDENGLVGVNLSARPQFTYTRYPLGRALVEAVKTACETEVAMFRDLGKAVGLLPASQNEQFMGIVGIVDIAAQAFDQSWYSFLWLLSVLSLNIALMNLLPIPGLDGGHIMFFTIEAILGRPVDPRWRDTLTSAFFQLMVLLALVLLWKDIARLW